MAGDTDNIQLKGASEETTAAATVGSGRRRHAKSGGGLQWGRDDGGERRRRQLSGDDGCDGGRPQRRTTTATADGDGGGRRRRRMTTAPEIERRTRRSLASHRPPLSIPSLVDCCSPSVAIALVAVARPPPLSPSLDEASRHIASYRGGFAYHRHCGRVVGCVAERCNHRIISYDITRCWRILMFSSLRSTPT